MIFTDGLSRPEGPTLLPDGSWLVVEMGEDRGCVTHISADGKTKRVIAKTGRPNGLALDKEGIIWAAESINPPSLLRLTMDGQAEVFMTACNDEPFLFPNDLAFGPDGALYMTDSGIPYPEWRRQRADYKNAHTDGRVYRIDLKSKTATKLDSGLRLTNGIAFGHDNSLYVNETITGNVLRYRWEGGAITLKREMFANVLDPAGPDMFKGPDGMAFGHNGRLYVTVLGQGDVTVLSPDGEVVERLPLEGKLPTNVAFGSPGTKRIYVTEQGVGRMEVLEVDTDGLPLHG
jgi:gluconolactonase